MSNLKILISILFIFLFINNLFSQTIPQTFNYQAVARDYQGFPIANQDIVIEVTILQGNNCENGGSCNDLWQELHYPVTNEFGLFSIEIGAGQSTFEGSEVVYTNINWNDVTSGNYFLKVRVDFGGALFGNGLIDMGITEFLSVPYSLSSEISLDVARTGGKLPFGLTDLSDVNLAGPTDGQILKWDNVQSKWINGTGGSGGATILDDLDGVIIGTPVSNNVLFYNGTDWVNQTLSLGNLGGVNLGALAPNHVLLFNGTNWINSAVPAVAIEDLINVDINTPSNNQVLLYDGTNWINSTPSGAINYWTLSGSDIYSNNTGKVGIGITVPLGKFHVNTAGIEPFMVTGEWTATSTLTAVTSGSKMFFHPANASFRAGYSVDGTHWTNANLGDVSAAFGQNNISFGSYSFSAGNGNKANGVSSTSFGESNTSAGVGGFTSGVSNTANGDYSFALGRSCTTDGTLSQIGEGSMASGWLNTTSGKYSVAFGVGTRTREFAMFAIGHYNNIYQGGSQTDWSLTGTAPLFVIGNGTDAANRSDAFVVFHNGDAGLRGTLTTNAVIVPSDKNLKENIKDVENSLESILKLNPVTYTWKPETFLYKNMGNTLQIGFLAQDLEVIFPELVKEDNTLGYKTINYLGLIPVLTEAIKEQQQQIDELKLENEELKIENQKNSEKIDELIKRVDALEIK